MSTDRRMKKKNKGEDRISSLPDELIHQILSFVDTKLGVQTSVLSKRWKLIWTTLPCLKFIWKYEFAGEYLNRRYQLSQIANEVPPKNIDKLTRHVLNRRNHISQISHLELVFLTPGLLAKFVKYAISHHVQYLKVHLRFKHKPYKLSNFNSVSIRELKLRMIFEDIVSESDCWNLPALETLHLSRLSVHYENQSIPYICLTCLPALRTLCLENWDLRQLSLSFNLTALTTLFVIESVLPNKVWNFPALKSLELHDVEFSENVSDIFTALVSLQNLTLVFCEIPQNCSLPCPELVNLKIKTRYRCRQHYSYRYGCTNHYSFSYNETPNNKVVVLAPNLRNFTSVGIFAITFGDSKLDNVNINMRGWIDKKNVRWEKEYKQSYQWFKFMLPGLASAKILNFDLETIEALSSISDILVSSPSPFYNLKYVKLPHGCKAASISSTLRSYLLGASPTATFVTTLPQNNMNPHTSAASVTSQNVVLREPLAAPTKVLVDSGNVHKSVCIDTVDMEVQEEHVVQNSVEHADREHVGSPVEGTKNDLVSSSTENGDFGLWRGHAVNSEFVCLLNIILNKYPETFEHFTTKSKKFCTMKLNMLCTSVNDFTKISLTKVDTETVAEYRDVFAELKKLGFNVSWLVSRLNFVEQLRFSQPLLPELHAIDCDIDDAKSKLQDLQIVDDTKTKLQDLETLRDEKMQEIQKAFGTMGTNLVVGYIGDDLLSGP